MNHAMRIEEEYHYRCAVASKLGFVNNFSHIASLFEVLAVLLVF